MDTRGDVIIRGLWDIHTNSIIYVKLDDSDEDTYRFDTMSTLLDKWEKIKNYKNDKHCHKQRKRFSLFVIYVDVMLGRGALVTIANLS